MPRSPKSLALVLIERGLCLPMPDLGSFSASLFPAWGEFCLLDIALAPAAVVPQVKPYLFVPQAYQGVLQLVDVHRQAPLKAILLGGTRSDLLACLKAVDAEILLLAPTSEPALFDLSQVLETFARGRRDRVVKLSIDGTPTDLYVISSRRLLQMLRAPDHRPYLDDDPVATLFDRLLHTMFDEMMDVPGILVYQHDLTRFHAGHLRCFVRHPLDPTVVRWWRRLDSKRGEASPSYVTTSGQVRNSLISSGVEVAGLVENSVLFPGVTVGSNAEVYNSVLMNDNHVGPRCIIRNALVLPNRKETLRASVNLHESAEIGGPSRSTRNQDYPQQVHSGLTVLGFSAEVPKGLRVEEGVYLSGAVPAATLRRVRRIAGGSTPGVKGL